jgi:protein O-mannosyl-transferase
MAGPRANRRRSSQRSGVARHHRFPNASTAIALLASAVYINALDNPFVYDDTFTVTRNPSIVDPTNIRFLLAYTPFRPIVNISYAIDLAIWGYRPVGFHVTNVAIHATVAVLLYRLLSRLLADVRTRSGQPLEPHVALAETWAAFIPAALFAVHPIFTEAVAYVSGRSELLCGMFFLASLLCARRAMLPDSSAGSVRYATAGAFVFGGLALLTKEVAAALPVVVLAYDWLVLPGTREARTRRLKHVFLPLLVILAAAGTFRARSLVGRDATITASPLLNILTQSIVIWRYLSLLAVPIGQSIMHATHTVVSVLDVRALVAASGLIAAAVAAYSVRRVHPLVPFGLLWFIAALAPSSSLVTFWEGMAEHRVYVAAAGIFVAVTPFTLSVGHRLSRSRTGLGNVFAVAFALAVTALSCLTLARNEVWASAVKLWSEATLAVPGRWEPHYALGDAFREADNCPAAIIEYEATLRLSPRHRDARTNLGICLAQTGRFSEAEAAFNEALKLDPTFARAYTNLGSLALIRGDHTNARDYYTKAISLESKNIIARMQLASVYEVAFHEYRTAARLCAEAQSIAPATPGVVECIRRNEKMAEGQGQGR